MQDGDSGSDCRRAQGDEYFRRRDQELLEEMRRRSDVERERRAMGEAIGVSDAEVLVELQLAGYKAETIGLLELAPLVQVAWADGSVSAHERDVILRIAAREHVVHDSPAHITLNVALERRPSDEFFDTSLRAIQAMLAGLQPNVRRTLHRKLVDNCTAAAVASGGFWGRGKISHEEELVLGHITAALEHGHTPPAATRK